MVSFGTQTAESQNRKRRHRCFLPHRKTNKRRNAIPYTSCKVWHLINISRLPALHRSKDNVITIQYFRQGKYCLISSGYSGISSLLQCRLVP